MLPCLAGGVLGGGFIELAVRNFVMSEATNAHIQQHLRNEQKYDIRLNCSEPLFVFYHWCLSPGIDDFESAFGQLLPL